MMTKEKVLEQLEGLIEYAKDNISGEDQEADDTWKGDIECCNICKDLVDKYYKPLMVPSLEEIKADYNEVYALFDGIKNPLKLREMAEKYHLTIEINGMEDRCGNWEEIDSTEFVRIESFNNLGYIYFYYNDNNIHCLFDVWACEVDDYFIMDVDMEHLDAAYEDGIKWINERQESNER